MRYGNIKEEIGRAKLTLLGDITDLPTSLALFADDTQMSNAIVAALVKTGNKDLETIMATEWNRFIGWRQSPEDNRECGVNLSCRSCKYGLRGSLVRKWRGKFKGLRHLNAGGRG